MRAIFRVAIGSRAERNPPFALDNRGKRSVVIDVRAPAGRAAAYRLVERADVFITNMRPDALARLGFDHETLTGRFPRLVYASITGYGLGGAERDRPGYDVGAFWARSGIAHALTEEGVAPPHLRGGLGDHVTGVTTLAGVLAALLDRERTGRGRVVETSLLRTGMYCLGWDLGIQLEFDKVRPQVRRWEAETPLVNCYRAADGAWFWLIGLEADRHFPILADCLGRPDLTTDPRFVDARARRHNRVALIRLLDEAFATAPRATWAERFDAAGVWWAPVQSPAEVVRDPQAAAAGAFVDVPTRDGGTDRGIASPITFAGERLAPGPVPALGEHTEAVLREAGLDEAEIAALRRDGLLGGG